MEGTVIILGLLVTLGETSIRGGRKWKEKEPLEWASTGKALNLTFIEGVTSTILVDFCQMVDCGDLTEARRLRWADKYVCYIPSGTDCLVWNQVLWTTAHQDWGYNILGIKWFKRKTHHNKGGQFSLYPWQRLQSINGYILWEHG